MSIAFMRQPPAFRLMCMIILPAMLSMYGMSAIVTVFMVNDLGLPEGNAFLINGAASAFSTIIYALGGYLADRHLGVKRSLIIGNTAIVIFLFVLSYAAYIGSFQLAMLGLAGGCVSRAMANNCPSNLISKAYDKKDPRIDSAFTLYYMMINVGSCISLVITPVIAHKYSYAVGFAIAGAWNILTVLIYLALSNWVKGIGSLPDFAKIGVGKPFLVVLGMLGLTGLGSWLIAHHEIMEVMLMAAVVVAIFLFLSYMRKEDRLQRSKMLASLVLLGFSVAFFILYKQMGSSLTFFAIHNTRHEFLGIPFDPVSSQALNPFWIIILSPILAFWYERSAKQKKGLSLSGKFALGMVCCAFAFLSLAFGASFMADSFGRVSAVWPPVSA